MSKSSASVEVNKILGIIYGGLSSRFWLFRKHINCMPREKTVKDSSFPFFAWECITLHLKHRDVDLVIRDQRQMDLLLKFLVHSLNTIDGNKDSALSLKKYLIDQTKRG